MIILFGSSTYLHIEWLPACLVWFDDTWPFVHARKGERVA